MGLATPAGISVPPISTFPESTGDIKTVNSTVVPDGAIAVGIAAGAAGAGAAGAGATSQEYNLKAPVRLPYLVVVIDELASLIFDAPGVKTKLVQLAQRGRAVGVHAIIATQRPEVRVIDGMIKAQFPSRVAFTVFGSRDSMIILDVGGAQKLLGQGDMLFKDVSESHQVRVQGLYVQDREIDRIAKYWRDHPMGPPDRMITQ
jgi:S-DNA-T family DNA segregation ATPase FtsK/SpoIIIE